MTAEDRLSMFSDFMGRPEYRRLRLLETDDTAWRVVTGIKKLLTYDCGGASVGESRFRSGDRTTHLRTYTYYEAHQSGVTFETSMQLQHTDDPRAKLNIYSAGKSWVARSTSLDLLPVTTTYSMSVNSQGSLIAVTCPQQGHPAPQQSAVWMTAFDFEQLAKDLDTMQNLGTLSG